MEKSRKPKIRFKGFTDDWEQRKLEETNTYFTDGNYGEAYPKASDITENGVGVPFLTGGNLKNGLLDLKDATYITLQKHMQLTSGHLVEDDIVIAVRGSLGSLGYVNKENSGWNINSQLAIIRTNKSVLNGKYLIQFLSSDIGQKELLSKQTGSALKQLPIGAIRDVYVPMTSVEEQILIGDYFRSIDHLITLHQRKLDKLVNVKKSMLEKMFPKQGSKVPNIRFAGFADDWEQRKLGDVVKEITRNDPESEAPIMMITANNGFIEQSERYAFNNAGESLKKYILLKKGELAYNHGASKLRPYGSCFALTTAENARIPFVYHCFSAENQNAEFMSIELNGAEIENQLRKIVSSGARMDGLLNISFDEYTSVSVLLPGTEEQDRIADFFRHLDNLITLHQRKLEKLKNIKKSMLDKMFI